MRKGVDHIGICVVFFCHDGKGSFLLCERSNYARDEKGTWDPGGGGVNFKEPIMKTLEREIKEEYCVSPLKTEFLGYRDVHRTDHKKRKTHWIALDFKVLIDKKKVKNGDPKKHKQVKWFRLDNLPNPLHSQFPDFIRRYKRHLIKS